MSVGNPPFDLATLASYTRLAQQYRDDSAAAVAAGGIVAFYDTYALANAAVGGLAANAVVQVWADENMGGRRSLYQKLAGVLTWKAFADGPNAGGAGLGAMIRRPKGVLVHLGDSNTNGRPGWRTAYTADWLSKGGIFEGWTSYNMGHNGSLLNGWATTLVADAITPGANAGAMPADYNGTDPDHELIRTINANPDVIVIRLGTNDENSPANRAGNGLEATLRANLATLVNFLLARTHAAIWLSMPQPFAGEDFITGGSNITQWVDDAETAEACRRIRVVYREWIGKSDRVEVFDSHQALFGTSCDDKAVNAQDPFGQGALIADSLHCSDLGYMRQAQMMSMQADVSYARSPIYTIEPSIIPRDAMWTGTLFCRDAALGAVTNAAVSFDLSPSNVLGNASRAADQSTGQPNSLRRKRAIEDTAKTASLAVLRQLLGVTNKAKLSAYNWANGQTYSLSNLTLSQLVAASGTIPEYAQLTLTSGASMAGLGGGAVTFYVTDETALPFARPRSAATSMSTTDKTFGVPYNGFTINAGVAFRKPHANAAVISVYQQNQADQRQVDGTGTFAAPGKLLGTFSFLANGARAAFVFDPTNFPAGTLKMTTDWLMARVTTGSIATEFSGVGADLMLTSS